VPRVIITEGAALGLERCRKFLAEKNPGAARRAGNTIAQAFVILETEPEIGRPYEDLIELRELVIEFGAAGYVALYKFDVESDKVYVLAFRHQKEVDY